MLITPPFQKYRSGHNKSIPNYQNICLTVAYILWYYQVDYYTVVYHIRNTKNFDIQCELQGANHEKKTTTVVLTLPVVYEDKFEITYYYVAKEAERSCIFRLPIPNIYYINFCSMPISAAWNNSIVNSNCLSHFKVSSLVSNVRGKAENENGSDAVKSIENQENNSQETESLDNDLSQKDILEVVLEKEILPVKEEKDEPAELVCCDEGKDIYLQRQTDNLKQTGFAEEST